MEKCTLSKWLSFINQKNEIISIDSWQIEEKGMATKLLSAVLFLRINW